MKKNFSFSFTKKNLLTVFIALVALCNSNLFAQPIDSGRQVPKMWVYDTLAKPREAEFANQRVLLNTAQSLFIDYDMNRINEMMNYFDTATGIKLADTNNIRNIRIYIASYSDTGVFVPIGESGNLTLLFSPLINGVVKGYFLITPGPNGVFEQLHDAIAQEWQDNYANRQMKTLLSVLIGSDSLNYINKIMNNQDFSDTRYMTYQYIPWKDFFVNEVLYQDTANGVNINGIRAYFSAYTALGETNNGGRRKYRLHILFEFAHDSTLYSIESAPDFINRRQQSRGRGGDNGQLYP